MRQSPLIFVRARVHPGTPTLILSEANDYSKPVYLTQLAQLVNKNRVILVRYPPRGSGGYGFNGTLFNFGQRIFRTLYLVNGPNVKAMRQALEEDLIDPLQQVIYVAEFASVPGREECYTQEHIDNLVAAMDQGNKTALDWGVLLDGEFMKENKTVSHYQSLMKFESFKYLFVRYGMIDNDMKLTDDEARHIKYRIARFDRETFLFMNHDLRRQIHKHENIAHPTEGEEPTPEPEEVSHGTMPTVEPLTNEPLTLKPIPPLETNLTFPTVNFSDAGRQLAGQKLVVVMGMVVAIGLWLKLC